MILPLIVAAHIEIRDWHWMQNGQANCLRVCRDRSSVDSRLSTKDYGQCGLSPIMHLPKAFSHEVAHIHLTDSGDFRLRSGGSCEVRSTPSDDACTTKDIWMASCESVDEECSDPPVRAVLTRAAAPSMISKQPDSGSAHCPLQARLFAEVTSFAPAVRVLGPPWWSSWL
jgi:hypothetical protein